MLTTMSAMDTAAAQHVLQVTTVQQLQLREMHCHGNDLLTITPPLMLRQQGLRHGHMR